MSKNKYFKTVYTIEVLTTEEKLTDIGMEEIAYQCMGGDCSGIISDTVITILTRKEMTAALIAQGSEPEFLLGEDEEESED